MSLVIYDELKIVLQLMSEINSGISVKKNGSTYTNASGVPFANTLNIQTVVAHAFTLNATTQLYTLLPSVDGTVTIEDYLVSTNRYNFTQTSPSSNNLYLGDNVVVDSVNQHVDFGLSYLTKVKDAVNGTDVPAFHQIIDIKEDLQDRIDTVDFSLNSLQTEINNILNGATISNFKSLKDFIDGLETTDASDEALQIARLTSYIDDETKRATISESFLQLGISGEILRAKQAESDLSYNLNFEMTRATNAENGLSTRLTSEVNRATASENVLTSKQVTSINVLSTPSFYADADKPMLIPPNVYSYFDGFYYKNMHDAASPTNGIANKINWYMPQVMTFSQINCFSFNINVLSNKQLPFVAIYKVTANGIIDVNNKRVYEIPNPSTIPVNAPGVTTYLPYQFYFDMCGNNLNTLIDYGLVRKPLSLITSNQWSPGTINPSDYVVITLHTNSAAKKFEEEFVIESFCIGTVNKTFEYKFSTDQLSLSSEISRATSRESILDASLNLLKTKQYNDNITVTGLINDVSGELIIVSDKLYDEIERATNKEDVLHKEITSFIGQDVQFDACGNYIPDTNHPTFVNFYNTQANPNNNNNYNLTTDRRLELLTDYIKQLEISHINLNAYLFGANALPHRSIGDANPNGPATTASIYPYNSTLRP
jgi:hypothetical protein